MKTIIAITIMLSTLSIPANQEYDTHIWSVEYNGDIYTYVATTPDADGAYIVTLDGETVYITDIVGGENR